MISNSTRCPTIPYYKFVAGEPWVSINTPGEKILNPGFGVNLTQWLFNPISEFNAKEIGEAILAGIENFEPRVKLNNVNVMVDYEQSQYEIKLVLTIPSLSIINRGYDAILNQPGFDFLHHDPTIQ